MTKPTMSSSKRMDSSWLGIETIEIVMKIKWSSRRWHTNWISFRNWLTLVKRIHVFFRSTIVIVLSSKSEIDQSWEQNLYQFYKQRKDHFWDHFWFTSPKYLHKMIQRICTMIAVTSSSPLRKQHVTPQILRSLYSVEKEKRR